VVIVSGLSQGPVTGNAHWNPLVAQLEAAPFGYAQRDIALFSYADDPSGAGVPCQDAVISSQQLDKFLQAQRMAGYGHAVLVGHSFGGLLSVLTAMIDPSLTAGPRPFVRTIVTVDSPLLGVNHARASMWVSRYGTCRAIDQLYAVQQRGLTWESELSGAVQSWAAQGVRLLAVANRSDCTFNPSACGLVWMTDGTRDQLVPVAGPGVNLVVDTVTDLISHDAALYSPDVVLAIAKAVGYQAT
jgi:pimeloyl-ACP methyl ester carboxylesterase